MTVVFVGLTIKDLDVVIVRQRTKKAAPCARDSMNKELGTVDSRGGVASQIQHYHITTTFEFLYCT